jgi:hypothetical protein
MNHILKPTRFMAAATLLASTTALAVDLTITDGTPTLHYNDTDAAPPYEWTVSGLSNAGATEGTFTITSWHSNSIRNILQIDDDTPNALVTSNGTVSLADNGLTILPDVNSITLGFQANSGGNAIALGYFASSAGPYSAALGVAALATGYSSIALGNSATSGGDYSAALGQYSNAAGNDSIALGYLAESDGDYSTALGYVAKSFGESSIALGSFASSAGPYSTALGFRASAPNSNTIVLGSIPGVNNATNYANVGMGTTAPSQAVDVERSEAAARFQLSSFTANVTEAPQYIQRRSRGTAAAPTAVLSNDNLGLFSFRGYNGATMGGSRATITAQAAGNFTNSSTPTRLIFATTPVGQTTPQQVLVITPDGKVQVNGQNLTVPDYVFEDDYELMPLEELRAFIDANGHLPGIAPAAEVNANGLDLAGSQMGLLQKVEELTLYTLKQEQRLAVQDAENDRLRNEVARLQQDQASMAVLLERLSQRFATEDSP